MNEEKQIGEMADDIDQAIDNNMTWHDIDGITNIDSRGMAKELTAKGYLKQKEGEWIDTGDFELDNIYSGWKCSLCGYIFCGNKTNFCSNCGAKMREGV